MRLSEHHEKLNERGEGRCSVPMWMGGCPSGFCDTKAFGFHVNKQVYDGYVGGLACPGHGGPSAPPATVQTLIDRAVDVLQRHAPPDGLSDHDALSELYGIFDGPDFRAVYGKVLVR